ncbi:MAG TPA: 4-hydroxythreonine-4-phosphate dehydrogenase PdxA, partial [Gammaproteobacteria bacterium]|nr:4-hydroxythreonine-4-phosphate dehydrogenase PdxA [Gammaproteobacteria bacterium]
MSGPLAPIALTTGEPAGIGPDICVRLAQRAHAVPLVAIGDMRVLQARAEQLSIALRLEPYRRNAALPQHAGVLQVLDIPVRNRVTPGRLDPGNAGYVLAVLDRAVEGCLSGEFAAMVTAPVNKAVINDAGIAFSGHTEYLAARCNAPAPVMLLVADT